MIQIEHFLKKYPTKTIRLDDFSSKALGLYIEGVNGSGKTTLLKAMAGLIPYEGLIRVPRPILYLDAELPLPPVCLRDIKSFLTPAMLHLYDTWFTPQEDRLTPVTCSLGMKQKLRLLLALSAPVKTLALDEPFRGLDQAAIQTVLEVLEESSQTMVMTSHERFEVPPQWAIIHGF
jgi:ABC-type multidrug transport system ATPase subunit